MVSLSSQNRCYSGRPEFRPPSEAAAVSQPNSGAQIRRRDLLWASAAGRPERIAEMP